MSKFLVFSITRAKEVSMDIIDIHEPDVDPYEHAAKALTPPYLGECIVVKEDDVRRFKLKSHVVEV